MGIAGCGEDPRPPQCHDQHCGGKRGSKKLMAEPEGPLGIRGMIISGEDGSDVLLAAGTERREVLWDIVFSMLPQENSCCWVTTIRPVAVVG